jgi:hypothetical protein
MCLWCCWKDLDEQYFNRIYLVRFGFRVWEILIFKIIFLLLKIQNKFQKTRFWKENSVQAPFPFIFVGCSKKIANIHCKTMFTCWVSLFCNGFTLGPMAQRATLVWFYVSSRYLYGGESSKLQYFFSCDGLLGYSKRLIERTSLLRQRATQRVSLKRKKIK